MFLMQKLLVSKNKKIKIKEEERYFTYHFPTPGVGMVEKNNVRKINDGRIRLGEKEYVNLM
jgi:hypothetical protein